MWFNCNFHQHVLSFTHRAVGGWVSEKATERACHAQDRGLGRSRAGDAQPADSPGCGHESHGGGPKASEGAGGAA